jgi:hypothetical protein
MAATGLEGFLAVYKASNAHPGDAQVEQALLDTMDRRDRVLRVRSNLRRRG